MWVKLSDVSMRFLSGEDGVEEKRPDPLFVASVEKGFKVLHAVADAGRPLGLSDIARLSGLDKSAAQRFAATLHTLGYLRKDADRRFSLASSLMDFTFQYLRGHPVVAAAMPHLIDAGQQCRETINLSERDGTELVYIARIPIRRTELFAMLVGRRMPVYCTAGGRAMLSWLSAEDAAGVIDASDRRALTPHTITDRGQILDLIAQARTDGFSIADQECMIGQIAVASAVIGERGEPVAAVHCSVSTASWTLARARAELAPLVLETARLASRPPGPISG